MASEGKASRCGHVEFYPKGGADASVIPWGKWKPEGEHGLPVLPGLAHIRGAPDSLIPFAGPRPPSLVTCGLPFHRAPSWLRLLASPFQSAGDMEQICHPPELGNE